MDLVKGTTSTPSAPSGLAATTVSTSQIKLTWSDLSTNETGFKVERSVGTGGTWTQVAVTGAGATSYTDAGLAASTSYSYRVRATNGGGDSAYSNVATAATPSASAVPTAPTNLKAAPMTSSSIALTWTDNSGNETGFKIERSRDGVSFSQIGTVGTNVTTFTDPNAIWRLTYYYRVRAYNAGGNSAYSNTVAAATH